jgi:HK97 family phage portal protein
MMESSLRKVAVWGAANLIAGVCSSLPLDAFTGDGANKRAITLPVFFTDPDGTGQGLDDWIYQLVMSWLLRGNSVGHVLATDSMGRPSQILLQHPDKVSLWERPDGPEWAFSGKTVSSDAVWHKRAFPIPGARLGLSPIALHSITIGQGLAAAAYGIRWFIDGAHPSSILQNVDKAELTQAEASSVKAKFMAALRGTREPVTIGKGWTYTPIGVAANESQFLDTQGYTAAESARIFGPGVPEILGYETGGSMTYANIEQRSIDLLKYSLDRWLRKIEAALSALLPAPRYVKFNRSALLATDTLTRWKVHEIALRTKAEVVNEVREIEDMSPVPWGNEPVPVAAPAPTAGDTQKVTD